MRISRRGLFRLLVAAPIAAAMATPSFPCVRVGRMFGCTVMRSSQIVPLSPREHHATALRQADYIDDVIGRNTVSAGEAKRRVEWLDSVIRPLGLREHARG